MKGSLTATISTSLCSMLRVLSAHCFRYEAQKEINLRVAEDDTSNAAETVDTNLSRTSVAVVGSRGVAASYLDDHDE
jgi:hypothetical protein